MGLRLKDDVELDYDEANQIFSIEDLNTAQQFEFNSDGSTSIEPAAHSTSHESGGSDPLDVDTLQNADLKADLSSPDGTVMSSQIPDLAVTETFTVPDQAGRLALSDVQEGDVALQTDTDEGYIFTGGDPSLDANWSLLSNFDPPVDSVFGRVGDVVAQAGDYAASQISNFGSAVLNTIDGASITPNDVTATTVDGGTVTSTSSLIYEPIQTYDFSLPASTFSCPSPSGGTFPRSGFAVFWVEDPQDNQADITVTFRNNGTDISTFYLENGTVSQSTDVPVVDATADFCTSSGEIQAISDRGFQGNITANTHLERGLQRATRFSMIDETSIDEVVFKSSEPVDRLFNVTIYGFDTIG